MALLWRKIKQSCLHYNIMLAAQNAFKINNRECLFRTSLSSNLTLPRCLVEFIGLLIGIYKQGEQINTRFTAIASV
jgi:hypothetical protein